MTLDNSAASPPPHSAVQSAQNTAPNGLTSDEAQGRLKSDGPNAMPDTSAHPFRDALAKFWAPVPWLLEASIVLQLVLHKYFEAAVIAGLLIFNAALAYFQEGRAHRWRHDYLNHPCPDSRARLLRHDEGEGLTQSNSSPTN